jgi:tRNA threonylcarbamoyladenosine modification (KEOPS) complex  Pcc1 subunit
LESGSAVNADTGLRAELTFQSLRLVLHRNEYQLPPKKGLILISPQRVTAEIKISVPPNMTHVLLVSLKPEMAAPTSDRSVVTIDPTSSGILLKIEAEDVTALRAAVNSYLYWAQGIIDLTSKLGRNDP